MESEVLLEKAHHAYERGRLRHALAWVLVFPVLLAVGTLGCSGQVAAVVISSVVTLGCVMAAWRGKRWLAPVKDGLVAGLAASAAPLVVMPVCRATGGSVSVVALLVCTLAGVWLGRHLARGSPSSLPVTGAVALAVAVLGCAALGVGALVGMALAAGVAIPVFRRAAA